MKTLIATFFLCFTYANLAGGSVVCQNLFGSDETEKSIRALAGLRYQLDEAKVNNNRLLSLGPLEQQYQKKEQALLNYFLVNKTMTREEFFAKIETEVDLLQAEIRDEPKEKNLKMEDLIDSIPIDGSQAIFHRVEPTADMELKTKNYSINYRNEKPFGMMATPVTQVLWRKIVVLAKEKLPNRFNLLVENPSHFSGDLNPVENVSIREIEQWLAALNSLSHMAEPSLHQLIPDHSDGDLYELPSSGQWLIVAFENQPVVDLDKLVNIKDIAWHHPHSAGKTQPVATKSPTKIGSARFYDMFGNVRQWLRTFRIASNSDHEFEIEGFDYTSTNPTLYRSEIEAKGRKVKDSTIGFRLIREIKNP